ncbi:MAG: CDP-alcohol phosphatidyltransferase family protein [Gammaproteobacteria bacterium]|nr:CDP-alcohol phosphatidyltransferase family protein [Gammaproteobacteria bacterium]MBU2675662.1 CDP-alcohol phosphatidyltransferase family protein [Gammaproteobacteria bacterium]NNC56539.1 CDP-alcohol phosphatidyltransferase family protein [Woeseiaceae bacterium]NNL49397.1 CDP-alcohol phosphatidyltransferase family protein [Woeseiaceae bacterium]
MSLSWLPNAISLLRIVLVVPILSSILNGNFGLALALFFVAGFSDGIDGYLAKRFDWHSRTGALLDPVADKLLVAGTFITLAYTQHIAVWLTAVVILRDLVIVGGALAYNYFVRPVPGEPTRISKLNTALQLLFLLFVLSRAGFGWPDKISITVLGASVLITVVISGVDYVLSWSKRARAGE